MAKQIRLTTDDRASIDAAQSVLRQWVLADVGRFSTNGRSPPSPADCFLLALGQVKTAIVVTDDLGMHTLASDFDLPVWHGYQLLDKMRSAKVIDTELIREIYTALENNGDLTKSWKIAKHTTFSKIFGF